MPVNRRTAAQKTEVFAKEYGSGNNTYDPRRDGVTYSLLNRWLACKHQARFAVQRWSPVGTTASFLYGDLVHAVLALIHEMPALPDADTTSMVVDQEWEKLRTARDGDLWSAEQIEEFDVVLTQAHGVMRAYARYHAEKPTKLTWFKSEMEFKVPFAGVQLRGKMDGVLHQRTKRGPVNYWLFETKTRGLSFDGNLQTTLIRDLQVNIYLLALVELGLHPAGVVYNEVRRPQLRPLKGRGKDAVPETLREYQDRVEADAMTDPTKYFRRIEMAVTAKELAEFRAELTAMITEYTKWWQAGMPGWRYGMPCVGKFGACPFLGLCFEGSEDGLRRREQLFEELVY